MEDVTPDSLTTTNRVAFYRVVLDSDGPDTERDFVINRDSLGRGDTRGTLKKARDWARKRLAEIYD
jgi:hypothetical protein